MEQERLKLNEPPKKSSRLWIAVLAFMVLLALLTAAIASSRSADIGRSAAIPTQPVPEAFQTEAPGETPEPTPEPTPEATEEPATPAPTQQEYSRTRMIVDGKTAAVFASREAAEELLSSVQKYFEEQGGIPGDSVTELVNDVEFAEAEADEATMSVDDAFALFTGKRTPLRFKSTAAYFEDEPIPHTDAYSSDSTLPVGSRIVKIVGRDGLLRKAYVAVYVNGVKQSTKVTETRVVIAPVDGRIVLGSRSFGDDFRLGPDFGSNPIAAYALKFDAPAKGDILRFFGPFNGGFHHGVDIGVPAGTEVRASCSGTVVSVMERGSYGLMVEIEHGYSVSTRYAKLQDVTVQIGDSVELGDLIGHVSGSELVPHLHFELRIRGMAYNPLKVVPVNDIIG